jgi:hypothetical protein
MIWLLFAGRAEIILAFRTSNSVLTHVFRRHLVNDLPCIVLDIIIYLSFYDFYHVPELALDHVGVALENLVSHFLLKIVIFFLSECFSYLKIIQVLLAIVYWASGLRITDLDVLCKAFFADHVATAIEEDYLAHQLVFITFLTIQTL